MNLVYFLKDNQKNSSDDHEVGSCSLLDKFFLRTFNGTSLISYRGILLLFNRASYHFKYFCLFQLISSQLGNTILKFSFQNYRILCTNSSLLYNVVVLGMM